MKSLSAYFILLSICCARITADETTTEIIIEDSTKIEINKRNYNYIENVKEVFSNQVWDEDERDCFDQTISVLDNVQNFTLWATWIWDSMQLPTGYLYGSQYQLGSFDQCMKAPWVETHRELRTQYCLADVKLTKVNPKRGEKKFEPYGSAEDYMNTLTYHMRRYDKIIWGVCVPSVCKPKSISKFVSALLLNSHYEPVGLDSKIKVDSCQVAGEPHKYTLEFYIFIITVASLLVISIISTWYVNNKANKTDASFLTKFVKSFCMKKNGRDLMKVHEDGLECMYGIRFITACIVAISHVILFSNVSAVADGGDVEKTIDSNLGYFLLHVDLTVDTFLVMSGILFTYSSISSKSSQSPNPINLILKRYFRLVGAFGMVVFYMSAVSVHAGSGPLWPRLMGYEQDTCTNNWWVAMLMLNNYVKSLDICFLITWYIPADFHLYIIAVTLFLLYYYNHRLGIFTYVLLAVGAIALPGWATYKEHLPPLTIFNVKTQLDLRGDPSFNNTYIRTHNRAGSYFVGLALGYLIAKYKPANHRNVIPKKLALFGAIVGVSLMLGVLALGGGFYNREYNITESVMFAAINRNVWAFSVGLIIICCAYGSAPIVSGFLGWTPFAMLSKLSYGIYLTHTVFVQRNYFSARTPMKHDLFSMVIEGFGVIVSASIVSFLLWVLVEAPLVNITNLILFPRKQQNTKQNIVSKEDGDVDGDEDAKNIKDKNGYESNVNKNEVYINGIDKIGIQKIGIEKIENNSKTRL